MHRRGNPKDTNHTPLRPMSFAIRSISKKGLKKNNKVKFSKKYKDAIKNPYGVLAPDSDDNSKGQKLHDNNDSDNQANQLIEQNADAEENNINQPPSDPISGRSLNDTLQELSDITSTIASRLSQEEISQIGKDFSLTGIGKQLNNFAKQHSDRSLEDGVADPRVATGVDGNWENEKEAGLGILGVIAAAVFGSTPAGAVVMTMTTARYIYKEYFSSDSNNETRVKVERDPSRPVVIDGKEHWDIQYPDDYVSPEEQKRIKELMKRLERGLWMGDEVDQEDLISRHVPDKGVIGNQDNPKPWEDDDAINWGELGKPNLKQDDSTKAHTGDALVTDPPKDSGDGEGDVEPPEPPTGNGLRNISSNMSSSNSEMKGNTGLFKDFYQKAWAVDQDGEIDDITKHGKQVGDDSYRGWDMVAAEVINGVNTAIWIHETGKMSCWQLDSDWDYQSHQIHLDGTKGFKDEETQFGTDFDKDGLIGLVAEKM